MACRLAGAKPLSETNAGILLIGPLGTNFSEIFIEIQTFSLKKIRLKMSSAKCCSFRPGLIVLNNERKTHQAPKASSKLISNISVQEYNISSVSAMEILKCCTKPSIDIQSLYTSPICLLTLVNIQRALGPISQRVYELITEILWKSVLL